MAENDWQRCEPNDPNRCQSMDGTGQCRYQASNGTRYCPRHGASLGQASTQQRQVRMYRLHRWQNRLDELLGSDQIKSVREELGILRILLEELLGKCQKADDLILWSDKITHIVAMIERLVMSCQKLEEKSGTLLDQNSILALADSLGVILTKYIKNPDHLDEIGKEFIEQVTTLVRGTSTCQPQPVVSDHSVTVG